jgi:hypothetical protein
MTTFVADKGNISVETSLTKPQLSKFNRLTDKIIFADGAAYLPLEELHGVLFTNSRKNAVAIVNNHADVIKNYLVRDRARFRGFFVSTAIRPMGVYLLLETLATKNPGKANLYRESIFLLAYIVGKHPQVALNDRLQSQEFNTRVQTAFRELKQKHNCCQLSRWEFKADEEKHIHHIEAKALNPSLASEYSNLLVISKAVHEQYHHWLTTTNLTASKKSLIKYAKEKEYSVEALN